MADRRSWASLPNSVKQRISALALQEEEPKQERSAQRAVVFDGTAPPINEPYAQLQDQPAHRRGFLRQQPQLDLQPLPAGRVESPLAKLLRRAQARKAQQAIAEGPNSEREDHRIHPEREAGHPAGQAQRKGGAFAAGIDQPVPVKEDHGVHEREDHRFLERQAGESAASTTGGGSARHNAAPGQRNLGLPTSSHGNPSNGRDQGHGAGKALGASCAQASLQSAAQGASRSSNELAEGPGWAESNSVEPLRLHKEVIVLRDFLSQRTVRAAKEEASAVLSTQGQSAQVKGAFPGLESPARRDTAAFVRRDNLLAADCTALASAVDALRELQPRLSAAGYDVGGPPSFQLARFSANSAGYLRHSDRSPSCPAREVTAICYLNPSWEPRDAGELRVYARDTDGSTSVSVAPKGGTVAVFDSGLMHEVLPSYAERYALTLWLSRAQPMSARQTSSPQSTQQKASDAQLPASSAASSQTEAASPPTDQQHNLLQKQLSPSTATETRTSTQVQHGFGSKANVGLPAPQATASASAEPDKTGKIGITAYGPEGLQEKDQSTSQSPPSRNHAQSSQGASTHSREAALWSQGPHMVTTKRAADSDARGDKESALQDHWSQQPTTRYSLFSLSSSGSSSRGQPNLFQALLSSSPDISEEELAGSGFILLSPSAKPQAAPHSRQEPLQPIVAPAADLGSPDHSSTRPESSWNESSSARLGPAVRPAQIYSGSPSARDRSAPDAPQMQQVSTVGDSHDVHEGLPTSPQSSVSSSTPAEEDQALSWNRSAVDGRAPGRRTMGRGDGQGGRGCQLAGQHGDQLGAQRDGGAAVQRPTAPAGLQKSALAAHYDNRTDARPGGGLVAQRTDELVGSHHGVAGSHCEEAEGRGGLFQRLLHPIQEAAQVSPLCHGATKAQQEALEVGAGDGNGLIFVSIAAYRDPETQWTLADLFAKASAPERLRVGVVWQIDASEDQSFTQLPADKRWHPQIRQIRIDWREATGPCKARHLGQALWAGEQYYLQIDSHMRFAPGWDTQLLQWLRQAEAVSGEGKAVLSAYPPSYEGGGPAASLPHDCRGTLLCADRFDEAGMLRIKGRRFAQILEKPVRSLFWAAGFSFSSASLLLEVPYDASLAFLFFGEEMSMLARMWTRGFEVWAPPAAVAFHLWSRAYRHTFQKDIPQDAQRKAASQAEVRQLLGMIPSGKCAGDVLSREGPASKCAASLVRSEVAYGKRGRDGKFALGTVRSLENFYTSCSVDFVKGVISQQARLGGLDDDSSFA